MLSNTARLSIESEPLQRDVNCNSPTLGQMGVPHQRMQSEFLWCAAIRYIATSPLDVILIHRLFRELVKTTILEQDPPLG